MKSPLPVSLFTLVLCYSPLAHADKKSPIKPVATFTQLEGRTQIFTEPSKTPYAEKSLKQGTMALFEGEYYLIQTAKLGDAVPSGSIVRTFPDAHARIVYENGDQFYVGPGTSYRIAQKDNSKLDTDIKLLYGRLRGVISKDGPRKELKIRTRTATMGVRGTDFYVEENGLQGGTEISVLRGAVEITPSHSKESTRPTLLKTGMSASVLNATPVEKTEEKKEAEKTESKVEVRTTSKEDLVAVQNASELKIITQANPELALLEKKAVENTVKDIELYQPEFFKKINPSELNNIQALNSKMVSLAQAVAPSVPTKKRKPKASELKENDSDVYDQYFKKSE